MPADPLGRRRDGFLNGGFHLWQSTTGGLRAGHDALLVAAAVPATARGRALDMGAGSGAVGFATAFRAADLAVTLAERDATACELMRRSVVEADAAMRVRLSVTQIDLLARRDEREAAGLADGGFDWIVTNPPFHPTGGRASPDPARAAALSMPDGAFLVRWLRVAAALLRPGGQLVLISRPDNLALILEAAENRLGSLTLLPIHDAARPAKRLLVGAVRGSRAPLRLLPSFRLDEGARRRVSSGEAVPSLFGAA